jgi:hypothetical protein
MLKFNLLEDSKEFPFQPSFFSNPPFRSYFFVGDTALLIMTLSILGFVIVRYWPRLPTITVIWLGLVGFSMVPLWVLALRCYRRIHEAFRNSAESSVSGDSLLGIAMSSAAGMIYWGLFFAYFITAAVLMQLDRALSGR